jgi:hypothetical protein
VNVSNLENGRTTRLIVYSGFDTSGFLAFLSRDAANALGVQDGALVRIRMLQVSDLHTLSRFTEERAARGEFPPTEFTMLPAEERPPLLPFEPNNLDQISEGQSAPGIFDNLTPDPAFFIAPVNPQELQSELTELIDPALVIAPVPAETQPPILPAPTVAQQPNDLPATPAIQQANPLPTHSANSAPVISSLERGKYYLQIASFSKVESAKSEISRIESHLPVAVMSAVVGGNQVYRALIGPLTLGEAGALMHRFRDTYNGAFVRFVE